MSTSFEKKFDKQISDFQKYGTFTYEFDEVGNLIFDSTSDDFAEVYLSLPIQIFVPLSDYNKRLILLTNDPIKPRAFRCVLFSRGK